MKLLREIVYLLNAHQLRHIDIVIHPENQKKDKENDRYWALYKGLRDGLWPTDEAAAQHFKLDLKSQAFTRLVKGLEKKILNTLLFVDFDQAPFNDFTSAHHNSRTRHAVAEIMVTLGARTYGVAILEEIIKEAIARESVEMVVLTTKSILHSTVNDVSFRKEYLYYNEIFKAYWEAYQAEITVTQAYRDLVSRLANQKGYKPEDAKVAHSVALDLQPLAEKYPYLTLQLFYRHIVLYSKTMAHDWQGALQIAEDAIQFFRSKPYKLTTSIIGMENQRIGCLIMLGEHEKSQNIIEAILLPEYEGELQWFKTHELATVNDLYSGHYTEAWERVKMITKHKRFEQIATINQETWLLYRAYLHLLVRLGKVDLAPREKGEVLKQRKQALLNDMPTYNIDKRGGNIPTLILQVMFLLLEERTDELLNRIEALRKYSQRNVDPNSEHYRTDCFIRLLVLLPTYGEGAEKFNKKSEVLLQQLALGVNNLLDRSFELEVVPYEQQWGWCVEILSGGIRGLEI